MAKIEATRSYGGETELAGEAFEEAVAAAQAHVERTGATLVHAFEDERVIAGQGTIGLELAEQAPDAETVLIPIGGGGLAAGIALALKERRPGVRDDRRRLPAGVHDRRRDRGEAPGRAAVVDPRACPRRHGPGVRRGDHGGARPLRRADEAARRGRRRGRARGAPRGARARVGLGRGRALGREHRRDDAHLGASPRAHRGGPLPRDPAAHPRPAGRAPRRPRSDRRRPRATSSPSTTTARDAPRPRCRRSSRSSSRHATRSTARSSSRRCARPDTRSSASARRRRQDAT